MRGMIRPVVAAAAAIAAIASLAEGQGRVRTGNVAAAAAATVVSIAWKPMPVPVAASLAVGDRIVLKNLQGSYSVLERAAGFWRRRPLTMNCIKPPIPGYVCSGFKNAAGDCCSCLLGQTLDYGPSVEVRALIDFSPGANESEIFTLEEIGTLAAPVSSSAGLLQGTLDAQKGQYLTLINNRTLSTYTVGWGAQYYALKAGGQEIAKWSAGSARLLTDESLRLAILTGIGRQRSDNWGVPKNILASLK